MTSTSLPDDIQDAPPTTKLVYHALAATDEPATAKQLHRKCGISVASAHRAVNNLVDADVATEVHKLQDAPRTYYSVVTDSQNEKADRD